MSTNCGTVRLVPGPQGPPGTPGTDGTDGVSAFTTTTADFVMPAASATVVVSVVDSTWMAVGEPLFVLGAGTLKVTALAAQSVTLLNLGYTENIIAGTTIAAGAQVTPSGWKGAQGTPGDTTGALLSANNLSDVADAATSRANLGLGSAATQNSNTFLVRANNLSDVISQIAARANIGLGSSATHPASDFLATISNLSDVPSKPTARANLGILNGILSMALVQQTVTTALVTGGPNTRTLNNEAFDPDSIVSLSSGNFVLDAGSYVIVAFAAGYACDLHQLTLFDGTTEIAVGSTTNASTTGAVDIESTAMLVTRVTPAGSTTYTLRHYCQTTKTVNGQGLAAAGTLGTASDVFAQVLILKQA